MKKEVLVGDELFEEFIRENGYYVDKTELIFDLLSEGRNKVTLFTRPRRFGKTLAMSMMESFFDIRRTSQELFQGLNILERHPDFCGEWMNQYPVIFISFKDVEGLTFPSALKLLKTVFSDFCKKNVYLLENEKVDTDDAEKFRRLKSEIAELEDLKSALKTIMRMMHAVYGKQVILLIDEYDVPLAKARESRDPEYYRQMLDVIRGILSITLKTNEYLKFAVVTGCLQISKESIFTGVNNFSCYSVTSKKFSSYFGFTRDEVFNMLEEFGMSEKLGLIQEWYDGYIFGDTEVFCPWDVVKYMLSVIDGSGEEPQNFWANTSSNNILDEFVGQTAFDVSDKLEILLNGGTITEDISEELTYDHVSDSEKNYWSTLLMTGYISKADKAISKRRVSLRIPNQEISGLFVNAVVERFNRTLDTRDVDELLAALWRKDDITATNTLSEILLKSISYHDFHENYYHGMMKGIFTARGYAVKSNIEAGTGRLDLFVTDKKNRRAALLEFKISTDETNMDADCDAALKQVIDNKYYRELPPGYDHLIYGIAFYKKDARVKYLDMVL